MNRQILDALQACLQAMENGESLEAVLARYPRFAAELRPLLEASQAARRLSPERLPVGAITRSRARLLRTAAGLRSRKDASSRLKPSWRFVLASLAALALLALSGNGLLVASARSLPGDVLYPVKRSVEKTQLNLLSDPAQRQLLQQEFSQRRVDETKSLITIKRVTQVDFEGVVTGQTEDGWLVSGIRVLTTAQTRVDGRLQVGREVEVLGETQASGSVQAARLSVSLDEGEPASPANGSGNEAEDRTAPSPTQEQITPTPTPTGWQQDDHEATRTPGGTEWHEPGSRGTSTPEATDSENHWRSGTSTPEPTDSNAPGWTDTQTPQPTGEHSGDH